MDNKSSKAFLALLRFHVYLLGDGGGEASHSIGTSSSSVGWISSVVSPSASWVSTRVAASDGGGTSDMSTPGTRGTDVDASTSFAPVSGSSLSLGGFPFFSVGGFAGSPKRVVCLDRSFFSLSFPFLFVVPGGNGVRLNIGEMSKKVTLFALVSLDGFNFVEKALALLDWFDELGFPCEGILLYTRNRFASKWIIS